MADAPAGVVVSPSLPSISYPDLLRALGFNPDDVQAVVVTPVAAYAITPDYPEPTNPPEATDGD